MENTSMENSEVDQKGRQVSQYCLSLPTILRQILEQISTSELIQLSLVNKLWNFEARCVMRERGNLTANIQHGGVYNENRCHRLVEFGSVLEKMRVIPISGIRCHMYHSYDCYVTSKGSLHPSHQVILDRLPWKHFSVRFCDDWEDCSALVLVKKVLEDYCGMLEDLTLGYGKEERLRPILQDRVFPRLKSLTIESREFSSANNSSSSSFIKTLVSCALNLQELRVDMAIDLMVNVLEGSSAVLVPKYRFQPLLKPICEGLLGSIRSDLMEICIHTDDVDSGLLSNFIPKLLESSRPTLTTLIIDLLFAVPLMCYGICLDKLTTLQIHMNCYSLENIEQSVLNLPTGLDFTRVFPKLSQVTILDDYNAEFSADVVGAFIEQGNAELSRALPYRAINIKRLNLDEVRSIQESTLPLLARMFPDVQTVHTKDTPGCSFETLREHFLCLEELIES